MGPTPETNAVPPWVGTSTSKARVWSDAETTGHTTDTTNASVSTSVCRVMEPTTSLPAGSALVNVLA